MAEEPNETGQGETPQKQGKKKKIALKKQKPTARENKLLNQKAEKIRAYDASIIKGQKMGMADVLAAGALLAWAKEELKRLRLMGFQRWIEEVCKVAYKRAYNYMKVYQASIKDPRIKELGLTEAYVALGLVRRKKDAAGTAENSAGESAQAEPEDGADDRLPRRKIGSCEVELEDDFYVLEVEDGGDWQTTLLDAIGDLENLTAVLHDGGLLIRLKAKEPQEDTAVE